MKKSVSSDPSIVSYGIWLFLGIFLYLYLNLFRNALIDDAFITLQYAKTLITSGTWGFFPGVTANSATSPLNVILLSFLSLFTGPTTTAPLLLYWVCLLLMAWMLPRLSVQVSGSAVYGWLALVAFVFNPLLISTLGLESILFTTFFVLAIYCYQLQKWTLLAIALALLTLTRAEGLLFFLVFLLFLPANSVRIRLAILYLVCILPWYLFSWIYLGSFLPDTLFIKTNQESWQQWDFFNGVTTLYYYVYPLETLLSFSLLPLTVVLFHKKARETKLLILLAFAGLTHFLAYSFLKVPPFHWYYVPEASSIILLGSLGLGIMYRNSNQEWQRRALAALTVIYFLVPTFGMLYLLGRERFALQEMPVHSNWGTRAQYEEIGSWLKANHQNDTIRLVAGEIGTLVYYCDCRLLDQFSDRGWLKEYIAQHVSRGGLTSAFWKINFAFYAEPQYPPDDYVLRAYFREPNTEVEVLKEWNTSTKWIQHGFLLLSRQ